MANDDTPNPPGDEQSTDAPLDDLGQPAPSQPSSIGIAVQASSQLGLAVTPARPLLQPSRIPLSRMGAYGNAMEFVLGDWMKPLQDTFIEIGRVVRKLQEDFAPVVTALRPVVQSLASIDWDAWWDSQRVALIAAAKNGWFIQPEMAANAVSVDSEGNLPPDFERMLSEAVSAELDDIEARLVASFPERAHLIGEGFSLHRENRFYAAIPLFLNCSEGIVKAATNRSPFSTPGAAPEVADWMRRLPLERFDEMFAEALCIKHPLSTHTGDSRHRINHGVSLHYGTETSSLKAISFLGFVGWLFCPSEGPLAKAAEKAGWERTSRGWRPPPT